MRVLQINSVCGIGSTGRIATDLYWLLKKRGHECCIAYGRGEAPENIDSYKIGNKVDVVVHGLMARVTDRQGFYSKHATDGLVKWIKEYDPDIIHLHNIHGYYLNIEILFKALQEFGKPIIWTLHDCWAFTGHCAHFDFHGCSKWKTVCELCPQKQSYPASLLFDSSRVNYTEKKALFTAAPIVNLITPSFWLADLVKESFMGVFKMDIIPNGIDLEIFRPTDSDIRKRYHLRDKKLVLGVANVWDERKGFWDFFELAERLGDGYRVAMIGVNKHQMKLMKSNMIGIMRTNSTRELAEWYSVADVYVNTTYEDNFPTTNLEALACGTPIITYRTGGSVESVDETCGRVVEQRDVRGLAANIEALTYQKISSWCCIERAKRYNKDLQFGSYIDIYERFECFGKVSSEKRIEL